MAYFKSCLRTIWGQFSAQGKFNIDSVSGIYDNGNPVKVAVETRLAASVANRILFWNLDQCGLHGHYNGYQMWVIDS